MKLGILLSISVILNWIYNSVCHLESKCWQIKLDKWDLEQISVQFGTWVNVPFT